MRYAFSILLIALTSLAAVADLDSRRNDLPFSGLKRSLLLLHAALAAVGDRDAVHAVVNPVEVDRDRDKVVRVQRATCGNVQRFRR